MENVWNDVRYAWRMLIKSPGFAIVALLAPGLAIGANTAIFCLFNGVIWRPLPVKDPQQLVVVATQQRGLDFPIPLSYPDFQDYRQLKAVFSDMGGRVRPQSRGSDTDGKVPVPVRDAATVRLFPPGPALRCQRNADGLLAR